MVSAAENADRLSEHRAFVDAAADRRRRHVVYTSFFGAAPDCTFTLGRDHWATEERIRGTGMDTRSCATTSTSTSSRTWRATTV